jgi:hypothetical protein
MVWSQSKLKELLLFGKRRYLCREWMSKNGMVTIEAQGTAAVRQAPISLSRMDVK